jgi:hypothetical protein
MPIIKIQKTPMDLLKALILLEEGVYTAETHMNMFLNMVRNSGKVMKMKINFY